METSVATCEATGTAEDDVSRLGGVGSVKRGGRLKRTPLRRVSDKQRAVIDELAASAVVVIERSFGRCEANTPACPLREHEGVHRHHIKQRSAGGGHGPDNLLNVCAAAHDWIHAHPAESFEAGWLVQSWR